MNNHVHDIATTHPEKEQLHKYWWLRGTTEIAIVVGLYIIYSFVQASVNQPVSLAVQNANNIVQLEKTLGIFIELNVQHWFLQNSILVKLVNDVYSYLFYPVIIVFAIWAYNRHKQQYMVARNIFLVSAFIGLFSFAFFPMAPPRLMSGLGFVDTLAKYDAIHYSPSIPHFLVNQYAAMPSFHFGWTLLVGASTFLIAKSWWLKVLGALLPALMLISIIATGNHFILDALGGAVTIALACGLVFAFSAVVHRRKVKQDQDTEEIE